MTHYLANVLYLSNLHARESFMFLFSSADLFKIKFKKINHPGPPLECQTIWVQTVCKRLLTDDKIIHWHAKSYNR